MKIVCTQENLNRVLNAIGRIPKKDTTLPILNNILIEAQGSTIQFSATDLELGVTATVRGKIEEEGTVTLPAQLFSEYIATLPKQNVTIAAEEESAQITCGQFSSKILGMKNDDFPLIPKVDNGTDLVIPAGKIRDLVPRVAPFSAGDETRPEITGIHIAAQDGKLVFASTDGYRLAEAKMALNSGSLASPVIVPRQALLELTRMLSDEEEVTAKIGENQISFTFGDTELVSRLIEGNYPHYQDLIPEEFQTTITVNRHELINTIKATSLFSKHNVQDIVFEVKDGEAKLSSEASQVGESHSSLPVEVEGVGGFITFNARYLLEGLTNFSQDDIKMTFNAPTEPAILSSNEDSDYFYLIMPIKH